MLQASTVPLPRWRTISWFLIVLMVLSGAIGLSLITKDSSQPSDYIGSLDSLIAICSGFFIPLIHWSLNQEIKSQKKLVKQHHVSEESEINEIVSIQINEFKDVIEKIYQAASTGENSAILKEQIGTLNKRMEKFKDRYFAIQNAKHWIGDKENLKSMSKKSVDHLINQTRGFSVSHLLANIGINIQSRKQFYKQVYDSLTWIKNSFYAGTYIPTEELLGFRIKQPELVLRALEWITIEIMDKEELDSLSQAEIDLYFRELIARIRSQIQDNQLRST